MSKQETINGKKFKPRGPKAFQVKITSCGTDTLNGSYGIWKSKNALQLLYLAATKIAEEFVGEKNATTLQYHLACALLSALEYPKKELHKDIENTKKNLKYWDLVVGGGKEVKKKPIKNVVGIQTK